MDWEIIGATGEWVGAIAVIATLFYLAAQIRQNTNSIRGQTEMDYAKEAVAWVARVSTDPELQMIWQKYISGEPLDEAERSRYMWFNIEWFYLCEGIFRQHRRGLLDDGVWETLVDSLVTFLTQDKIIRTWWDSEAAIISPDYRAAVNERRASHPPQWDRKATTDRLITALRKTAANPET